VHFAEIYGADVGKDQVSRITDAVIAETTEWQKRPLDLPQAPCPHSIGSWPGGEAGDKVPHPVAVSGLESGPAISLSGLGR
jgi:mutator family transposase